MTPVSLVESNIKYIMSLFPIYAWACNKDMVQNSVIKIDVYHHHHHHDGIIIIINNNNNTCASNKWKQILTYHWISLVFYWKYYCSKILFILLHRNGWCLLLHAVSYKPTYFKTFEICFLLSTSHTYTSTVLMIHEIKEQVSLVLVT